MATRLAKSITDKQRLLGGTVFVQTKGTTKLIKVGPTGAITITPAFTEIDSRSDESGVSELLKKFVTQFDATMDIADIKMWTAWLYDALFLAQRTYRTQSAATGQTYVIEDVLKDGHTDVVKIPGIRPTLVSVSDGEDIDYVEYLDGQDEAGKHFTFHPGTSLLEIFGKPAGAGDDAIVSYSLPAITEAEKLVAWEIYKTNGWEGKVFIFGATQESNGEVVDAEIDFVTLRPNGGTGMKDVANENVGALNGTIRKVDGAYGRIFSREAFVG